jgi:hypothetical protein
MGKQLFVALKKDDILLSLLAWLFVGIQAVEAREPGIQGARAEAPGER